MNREAQINIHITIPKKKEIPLNTLFNRVGCRAIDILISFLGLILLAPVFLWIAVLIKKDSPGPIFYQGRRMGRNGKEFKILKFRTMYETQASYQGSKVTAHGDPRITPFGKWLRDSKVNEFPQLWNVLKGEMSIIGPRPEDPEIANAWPTLVRDTILSVRPGISSPASVIYRNEESLMGVGQELDTYLKEILPTKLRLDMLYVRHRNFFSDLDVIFWTAIVLLPKMRQQNFKEWRLYNGPMYQIANRHMLWLSIDLMLAAIAFILTTLVWRINMPINIGIQAAALYTICFAAVFSLSNYLFQMNSVEWSRAPNSNAVILGFSCAISAGFVLFVQQISKPALPIMPTSLVLFITLLSWMLFVAARYRERLITFLASQWIHLRGGVHGFGERVLIIGAGQNASIIEWLFNQSNFTRSFHIIGAVDDNPLLQGVTVGGVKVLGTTDEISEITDKNDIGLIIYTIQNIDDDNKQRILAICEHSGIKFVVMPDFLKIFSNSLTCPIIPRAENASRG
ncbi:MAG: sugar transferase [Anaerolineaceae bacterium]|nr:sugar transferase [Anaerolineaceae bacterium]